MLLNFLFGLIFKRLNFFIYIKKDIMKTAGWLLLSLGIMMIIIKGFSVPMKKNIVDAGPIQINKTENKWIGWSTYTGSLIAVIGVVLVVAGKKK
jgi:uncharacterized membrane protein